MSNNRKRLAKGMTRRSATHNQPSSTVLDLDVFRRIAEAASLPPCADCGAANGGQRTGHEDRCLQNALVST